VTFLDTFGEPLVVGDKVIAVRTEGKTVRMSKGEVRRFGNGAKEDRAFVVFAAQAPSRFIGWGAHFNSAQAAKDAGEGWFKTTRLAKVAAL